MLNATSGKVRSHWQVSMSTKLFIAAILVISAVLFAGIFASLNMTDTSAPSAKKEPTQTTYTTEDVKQHDSKASCWTIISGSVYDITSFIPRHPGGEEILRACGTDATNLFKTRQTSDGQPVGSGSPHSSNAEEQLKKLLIGKIR